MRSKEELTAYAAFLLSEKLRHLEDINVIQGKLDILSKIGIEVSESGDWITEEELELGVV